MMETSNEPVSYLSTVSIAGTVSAVTIDNVGFGYTTSTIDIKFSAPKSIVGVGTTAIATATISNGQVSAVTITNPDLDIQIQIHQESLQNFLHLCTKLLTPFRMFKVSGIITGISTTTGTGGPLPEFNFRAMKDYGEMAKNVASDALTAAGYPIMIMTLPLVMESLL